MTHKFSNKRQADLAGESMAVNITFIVLSGHKRGSSIIPNHKKHLCGPSEWRVKIMTFFRGNRTLVMITTFSLGILYALSAFPRMRSDSPLEYTPAVSKVLIPFSYLSGRGGVREY